MNARDGVDERRVAAEPEARPGAVAIPDCADFGELRLESFCAGGDLRVADVFGVALDEGGEIPGFALGGVVEDVGGYDFAVEAGGLSVALKLQTGVMRGSQVWKVDGGVRFLGEVIGQQAEIRERPPEDIVDDHDGGRLGIAGHIGVVVRQRCFLARGRAIPIEARFAVLARHDRIFRLPLNG